MTPATLLLLGCAAYCLALLALTAADALRPPS